MKKKGVMTLAEGSHKYKTDVELVLSDERKIRNYVLRTSLDGLSVWKHKYLHNYNASRYAIIYG